MLGQGPLPFMHRKKIHVLLVASAFASPIVQKSDCEILHSGFPIISAESCCNQSNYVVCNNDNRVIQVNQVPTINDAPNHIPIDIGDLVFLVRLNVAFSGLVGTIPSSIGDLANLETFYINYNNDLTGPLPDTMIKLTSLKTFGVDSSLTTATGVEKSLTWANVFAKECVYIGSAHEAAFNETAIIPSDEAQINQDLATVLNQVKTAIIQHTSSSDTIIFIGNSVSYYYYAFQDKDKRNVHALPYSGRFVTDYASHVQNDAHQATRRYCAQYIDPLGLSEQDISRIVLVDFSISGDGVWQFKELLKSCIDRSHSPGSSYVFKVPIIFLDLLPPDSLEEKFNSWGVHRSASSQEIDISETFGFDEITDLVFTDHEARHLVHVFAYDHQSAIIRLMPHFTLGKWIEYRGLDVLALWSAKPAVKWMLEKIKMIVG